MATRRDSQQEAARYWRKAIVTNPELFALVHELASLTTDGTLDDAMMAVSQIASTFRIPIDSLSDVINILAAETTLRSESILIWTYLTMTILRGAKGAEFLRIAMGMMTHMEPSIAAEYGMLGALKGKITLPDGEILPFASPEFWDDIIRGGHDGEPE